MQLSKLKIYIYVILMCLISYFICCNFYNVLCMSYLKKLVLNIFSFFLFLPSLGYKRTLFILFFLDLAPKWLLVAFHKHFICFEYKKSITIFIFFISNSSIFWIIMTFLALILKGVAFLNNKINIFEVNVLCIFNLPKFVLKIFFHIF